MAAEQTEKVVWATPVSYTHLDVYKRQVLCGFGDDIHYDAVCPWYYDGGLAAFLHLSQ